MDSSATVKVRLRKGAAPFGRGGPLAAFRERILCCGRKINNGRAEPFVEQQAGERIVRLLPPSHSPSRSVAAADFPRSVDASLAFSVCSTNKPSSLKKPVPPSERRGVPAYSSLSFPLDPLHSLSRALRSIEAPFDRFFETKMSVKTSKEVSFTVVTALVDTGFHSLNMLFPGSTVLGELYLGFAG